MNFQNIPSHIWPKLLQLPGDQGQFVSDDLQLVLTDAERETLLADGDAETGKPMGSR